MTRRGSGTIRGLSIPCRDYLLNIYLTSTDVHRNFLVKLEQKRGKEKHVNNRNATETRMEPDSLPLHHSEELIGHHSEKVQILKVTQPNAP